MFTERIRDLELDLQQTRARHEDKTADLDRCTELATQRLEELMLVKKALSDAQMDVRALKRRAEEAEARTQVSTTC